MASPAPEYDDQLVLVGQRLTHSLQDHDMYITYACQADISIGNIQTYADAFQDIFADAWKASLDTECTIREAYITVGLGGVDTLQGVSANLPVIGERAGASLPPNNNVLVRKRTGLGGRKNRGRVYMPYCPLESEVDEGGNISNSILDDLQAAADLWRGDLILANAPMVICNRILLNNPTPPPEKYVDEYRIGAEVTSLLVDSKVASQRRRIGR